MSEEITREEMTEDRAPRRGRKPGREEGGRNRRVPLGTPESKLTVPQAQDDKEHEYRWINDKPGRLMRAQAAGYEFVEDPTMQVGTGSTNGNSGADSRVSRLVGKDERGHPLYAYLMKIKREYYDEDQAAKQKAIDEVENTIKRGRFNEKAGDERYVPKEGIRIR